MKKNVLYILYIFAAIMVYPAYGMLGRAVQAGTKKLKAKSEKPVKLRAKISATNATPNNFEKKPSHSNKNRTLGERNRVKTTHAAQANYDMRKNSKLEKKSKSKPGENGTKIMAYGLVGDSKNPLLAGMVAGAIDNATEVNTATESIPHADIKKFNAQYGSGLLNAGKSTEETIAEKKEEVVLDESKKEDVPVLDKSAKKNTLHPEAQKVVHQLFAGSKKHLGQDKKIEKKEDTKNNQLVPIKMVPIKIFPHETNFPHLQSYEHPLARQILTGPSDVYIPRKTLQSIINKMNPYPAERALLRKNINQNVFDHAQGLLGDGTVSPKVVYSTVKNIGCVVDNRLIEAEIKKGVLSPETLKVPSQIIRNNQTIGIIPIPERSFSLILTGEKNGNNQLRVIAAPERAELIAKEVQEIFPQQAMEQEVELQGLPEAEKIIGARPKKVKNDEIVVEKGRQIQVATDVAEIRMVEKPVAFDDEQVKSIVPVKVKEIGIVQYVESNKQLMNIKEKESELAVRVPAVKGIVLQAQYKTDAIKDAAEIEKLASAKNVAFDVQDVEVKVVENPVAFDNEQVKSMVPVKIKDHYEVGQIDKIKKVAVDVVDNFVHVAAPVIALAGNNSVPPQIPKIVTDDNGMPEKNNIIIENSSQNFAERLEQKESVVEAKKVSTHENGNENNVNVEQQQQSILPAKIPVFSEGTDYKKNNTELQKDYPYPPIIISGENESKKDNNRPGKPFPKFPPPYHDSNNNDSDNNKPKEEKVADKDNQDSVVEDPHQSKNQQENMKNMPKNMPQKSGINPMGKNMGNGVQQQSSQPYVQNFDTMPQSKGILAPVTASEEENTENSDDQPRQIEPLDKRPEPAYTPNNNRILPSRLDKNSFFSNSDEDETWPGESHEQLPRSSKVEEYSLWTLLLFVAEFLRRRLMR